jgi:hypothetical protein
MLIEAGYPKRLGTPQRRMIEAEETPASADSITSPSLVVRSALTLQTPHAGLLRGHKRRRCVWLRHHALRPESIQQERRAGGVSRS